MKANIFQLIAAIAILVLLTDCQHGKNGSHEKVSEIQSSNDPEDESKNGREHRVYDFTKDVELVNELNISEIADSVEYIPLDDNVLLSRIIKLEANESNIYIKNVANTYVFDRKGNFIKSLYTVGRGPGEVYGTNFIVAKNDNIYVGSRWTKSLMVYTSTGELKDEKNYSPFEWYFHYYNDCIIFLPVANPIDNSFYVLRLVDDSLIYKHPFKFTQLSETSSAFSTGYVWFDNHQNELLFKEVVCDTIYSTNDFSDFEVQYVFNFGRRSLTPEDYFSEQQFSFENKEFVVSFKETNRFLILHGMDNGEECQYLIDKSDGNLKKSLRTSFTNDIDGGSMLHFWDIRFANYDDDVLYFFIQPFELIEKKDKISPNSRLREIANEVSENDNPILVLAKLKE